jgi:hypothetical protein
MPKATRSCKKKTGKFPPVALISAQWYWFQTSAVPMCGRVSFYCLVFGFLVFETGSQLHSPDWPWICNLPASTSWVLIAGMCNLPV